jgi:DMSO reductase family type II enzyme molybdopterin subunit
MNPRLTRRAFLQATASTAALTLLNLRLTTVAEGTVPEPSYLGVEDIYRQQWTWDRVAKGTHMANCVYQRNCCWNLYIKDNLVWREEQLATYPRTNADVPDFNPRGCQKGASYSRRMYDQARLTAPLKRAGERGEGKWTRISWDQALAEIADKYIDAMISKKDGPGSIYWDLGSSSTNGCHSLGLTRSGYLLDNPIFENTTEMGDDMPGASTTAGKVVFTGSMDDLFYSDLILVWSGNPTYTQIPNAHFIHEARYHGTHVVTITPDLSPSAIHSDEWVSVNVGTDAALALSLAQVIVEEKLYKAEFMVEQTDMPLLVRVDNRRLLRESDMSPGGADDVFYFFDTVKNKVVEVPKRSLELGGIKPALEGVFDVKITSGTVKVTTVFERLKAQLKGYTPEQTESITSVRASQVRALARRIVNAKACCNITTTNFSRFYHGMEMQRSIMLVFALTGHFGRRGANYTGVSMLSVDGAGPLTIASGKYPPKIGVAMIAAQNAAEMLKLKLAGYSTEMMIYHFARQDYAAGNILATALFHYQHGGLKELYGSAKRWDPYVMREFDDYLQEAVKKGWQFVPKTPPRILFAVGGNPLRRVRSYHKLIEHLLPKLDLLVTLDWRMSNTARYSDYVLPAAGYYEKDDIAWATALVPFCHACIEAVKPVGDSKTDWEFHCLFLKKVQERAKARGVTTFLDRQGKERRLDECYDDFTFQGRFTENNTEDMLQEILSVSTNLDNTTWKDLKGNGFARYTGVSLGPVYISNATDIEPHQTVVANTWHVQKKIPWPTLTRRLQFYIDHPFYEELGEVLPVHKDNPPIGGNYPLQMTSGHTRWSIHAAWRDQDTLLRLQRGEPTVLISPGDAEARSIADGARVRVYNDIGEFEVMARVAPPLKPGQVVIYHAWEPFQFKNGKCDQVLTPSPLNPIRLAGGYFHLQPMVMTGTPECHDRGTRVEVAKV